MCIQKVIQPILQIAVNTPETGIQHLGGPQQVLTLPLLAPTFGQDASLREEGRHRRSIKRLHFFYLGIWLEKINIALEYLQIYQQYSSRPTVSRTEI